MTGNGPVDIDAFREVMREAGIEEAVESTLEIFRVESPRTFERLGTAVERGNMPEVAQAAHALKSAASNIFAKALATSLDGVEKAGRSDDRAGVARLFADTRPLFAEVMRFVEDHLR